MNKIKQQIQEVLDADTTNLKMELPIVLGKLEDGTICFRDLTSLKNLLIAGSIGQGKTSCLNGIIISLSNKNLFWKPKLILISSKGYSSLCRLNSSTLAVTEYCEIMYTLEKLDKEMENRWKLFKEKGVKSLEEYENDFLDFVTIQRIVVVIDDYDELARMDKVKIENLIVHLAMLGHQVGIHLIISIRQIVYNVITGRIKAVIPARIAFRVISENESRIILDREGAEELDNVGKLIFSHYDEFLTLEGIQIGE